LISTKTKKKILTECEAILEDFKRSTMSLALVDHCSTNILAFKNEIS